MSVSSPISGGDGPLDRTPLGRRFLAPADVVEHWAAHGRAWAGGGEGPGVRDGETRGGAETLPGLQQQGKTSGWWSTSRWVKVERGVDGSTL